MRAGLLEKGEHLAVLAASHEAIGGGVVDRMQAESGTGAAPRVSVEQGGQVEVGEDVAVQREEAIVELGAERVGGVADRARRAQRARLGDVADPGATVVLVPQRLAQHVGQEAAGEHHLPHPVPGQPLDHVGEERPVDQRQGGLGHGLGERPQPRPFTSD